MKAGREREKLKSEGGGHAVRLCFQYTVLLFFNVTFIIDTEPT